MLFLNGRRTIGHSGKRRTNRIGDGNSRSAVFSQLMW